MTAAATNELTVTDGVAMTLIDSLAHLCDAASADIRRHVPEFDHVDPAAPATLRRALEQSYGELCSLLRADFPVAMTPPVGAFANAVTLRESGLGWSAADSAMRTAILLFRRAATALARPEALGDLDELLADYWGEYAVALADGYQRSRVSEEVALDERLPAAPATDAFVAERAPDTRRAARVRAGNEAIIEEFCEALEAAAREPRIAAKLASADTSVAIELADEDGVSATLLLDREPIEITRGGGGAPEATITITSADLTRMGSEEFHLAMAMARGRVQWSGAVRKFLRLAPVIQGILARDGVEDARQGVEAGRS
jgi:hypothetical protein